MKTEDIRIGAHYDCDKCGARHPPGLCVEELSDDDREKLGEYLEFIKRRKLRKP